MKQLFSIIGAVVLIVSLAVSAFSIQQAHKEKLAMEDDLFRRTSLLADSFKESIRPSFLANSTGTVHTLLEKFAGRERIKGLAVFDGKGALFAASSGFPEDMILNPELVGRSMDLNSPEGRFENGLAGKVYFYATPIREDGKVVGSLAILQRADYIDLALVDLWKNNILRLFVQLLLFSLAVVFIFRLVIYKPILAMAEEVRKARLGDGDDKASGLLGQSFFAPVASEIHKMAKSLRIARTSASEEARMRSEKLDTPWTAERLKEFFKGHLKDRQIFVVSNREPYEHYKVKNEIKYSVPASGMVTALEPVMAACGGLWLAHGSGEADRLTVDAQNKIKVPPDEPKYTLKRVWLTEQEKKGFYIGFSNETLWPLCHMAHTRPIFRKEDWNQYRKVNAKFAQELLAEIKDVQRPVVLVQDYHFALLPEIVKKSRPDAEIGLFWHIPWPNAESFSICPWRREILSGMLGADVLGFHTQQYCNNFFETGAKEIESLADYEKFSIKHDGHTSHIKTFPISVSFTGSEKPEAGTSPAEAAKSFGINTKLLGLGVDRMDYTKGILERLRGVEFFFDLHPAYKGQFTFLQIAAPSREDVEKYRKFAQEVSVEAERINRKFATEKWQPIVLSRRQLSHEEISPLYRAADVCLVTSLSDGMNLVAKEFAAARSDQGGVLVLSQFTGAAKDLKGALVINPYSAEETAEAIYKGITMPAVEQNRRMKKMRSAVKDYNVYRWAAEFLRAVTSLGEV